MNADTLMARIASATGRPWDNRTSTWRSFATISSGLCFFCGIIGILQGSKAYFREGHFSGGRPLRALSTVKAIKTQNDDQKTGVEIVRKAIMAPAKQIVDNAGDDGAVVVGKLLESKDYAFGYNAQTGEYGDLVKAGIIDPTKVVRTAIQDAASIAGLLITTEAMIAELPKKDSGPAMGGGGGMGGRDF